MSPRARRSVRIGSDLGIHLRAAGAIVQQAGHFEAEIWIEHHGVRANGKSIMSVLSLAAGKGAELILSAEGTDAEAAVAALARLVESGFMLS